MDSSYGWRTRKPCSHHHHHQRHPFFLCPHFPHTHLHPHPHHHHPHRHHRHHFSPHCPLHSFLSSTNSHSHICPRFTSSPPLPQNPEPINYDLSPNNMHLQVSEFNETFAPDALMMQEENKELEAEDDDEFIFVLTDEWKEFFAKSEAQKRLVKKRAKKKGKD